MSKKIRIIRIIARLNVGGPAIHVVLLNAGLDKQRFESLLVHGSLSRAEGDMSYYARQNLIRSVYIPRLRRELSIFNDLAALLKTYRIIREEQPDIIHTHTAKAGALGRVAGIIYNLIYFKRRKAVRLVHTFHGHVLEGYFSGLKTRVFVCVEKALAAFSDKLITVSEEVKKELVSFGVAPEEKVQVIPLGFELEKFLNIPVQDRMATDIGIVGRLVPIKNHKLFLDAASRTSKERPEVKFSVIGDGELRGELEGYSRALGLSARVKFLGWQKDLASVYSALDIVALTSINEGTPVSIIEAMASAKAVVATDIGGMQDLMGKESPDVRANKDKMFRVLEHGLLVKPQDPAAFAAALLFMLDNPDPCRKMAIRARDYVKDKFTKERLVRDMEKLYYSLQ